MNHLVVPSNQESTSIPNLITVESIEDWAYEQVGNELESNNPEKGLWTKLFVQAGGDDKQTRLLYISARVEKLIAMEKVRLSDISREQKDADPFTEARAYGLSEEEIEYLGKPIKAIHYVEKYSVPKSKILKAISLGKIHSVICRDVLWLQDRKIT